MKAAGWSAVLVAVLSFGAAPAAAQPARSFERVVQRAEARVEPTEVRRGQTVTWKFTVDLVPGWHTYPTTQPESAAEQYVTEFNFGKATGPAVFVDTLREPTPMTKPESALNIRELRFYEGTTTWERTAVIPPDAPPGEAEITVPIRLLACDDQGCLPPRRLMVKASMKVSDAPPVAVDPRYQEAVTKATAPRPAPPPQTQPSANPPTLPPAQPPTAAPPTAAPTAAARDWWTNHQEELNDIRSHLVGAEPATTQQASAGLLALVLTGAFWGFVTLITPCVFPMIPITVSFFLKQGEKERISPMKMALIYCGTIIVVLGVSALTLLAFFRKLSVDPIMNVALGALFIYFALSLFGAYDIRLPNFLTRFTAAREQQGGVVGTIFMALTFTIVSFTCVAPFLGGFGGLAASGNFSTPELALGGLAFASTFAAPFFLLALFPSLIRKLPKSGDWLSRVKVVMGLLEVAAALKFFRTAELRWLPMPEYFTYDLVLSAWVGLCVVGGLYLLNLFRLGHDGPSESIGVSRLLFGLGFIALGIYLLPGIFKLNAEGEPQRPRGAVFAWVDAFLLPEPSQSDLPFSPDLKGTLDDALRERQKSGQPQYVFIDFTGVTCTNCKFNERTVFTRGEIRRLFKNYRLAQLYTDDVPAEFYPGAMPLSDRRDHAEQNLQFQRQAFGTEQLPLYVILEPLPDGSVKVAGVYREGKINDPTAFADFLRQPLKR